MKSVIHTAEECMTNTNGGDLQENDIEAVLTTIKQFKGYDSIVLIADNWSNMRDYDLHKKINEPIHIILCGTELGLNPQYLDLAKHTKGSIHLPTQDVSNLEKVKEGESIAIGKFEYILLKGTFSKL